MGLRIETFDNARGGNTLYKALTHPAAVRRGRALLDRLARHTPVAIYDAGGAVEAFNVFFDLDQIEIAGIYVQQVERIGSMVLGRRAQPITELPYCHAPTIFVAAFDAERVLLQMPPDVPEGALAVSLDEMRIPVDRLTNKRSYLDPLNFATNFAFFRDAGGLHTRLVTTNYWSGYGAAEVSCWITLFAGDGRVLAEWCETGKSPASAIILDSRDIRERFGLPEFCGQLFLHIVGAAGHDVVKYALDIFDENGSTDRQCGGVLSCTHDANAWPAERYAGLPSPARGEKVLLWVQNSHAVAIPSGAIGLAPMGGERVTPICTPIAPFATCAVDVSELLPGLEWPSQIEVRAGKHVVRPRYEVLERGRRRIAHVNVERDDLKPAPELAKLQAMFGKGYLLPAPLMPRALWKSLALPTPMATCQTALPIAALVYDPNGREVLKQSLGRLPRAHRMALDFDQMESLDALGDGYGHIELVYDFSAGEEADGWLHALFRYRHRRSGHSAETSFGAHIFNTILTYRNEPQSYSGRPPGLSTRLFLRLGEPAYDTFCHLIYPASRRWVSMSDTAIILYDGAGCEVARSRLEIPCSGSRLWYYRSQFDEATRARAGRGAYIIVRDTTCRLFGYHGLIDGDGRFSLDHMFGF
ncbi:MAG: hypothetical protein JO095_01530 [Alphaproteobacteria bacterium]|nr:hypothetical protein [Alphaproteobacteria bacterium]